MSNWGSQRISTLDIPTAIILASFMHALAWRQEIVAYEVILAVRRLVTKYAGLCYFLYIILYVDMDLT